VYRCRYGTYCRVLELLKCMRRRADVLIFRHWDGNSTSTIFVLFQHLFIYYLIWLTFFSLCNGWFFVLTGHNSTSDRHPANIAWTLQACTILLLVPLMLVLFATMRTHGVWKRLQDQWTLLDCACYSLVLVSFCIRVKYQTEHNSSRVCSALATVFAWSKILYFLRAFKRAGPSGE
jgi:hypothetical protein